MTAAKTNDAEPTGRLPFVRCKIKACTRAVNFAAPFAPDLHWYG